MSWTVTKKLAQKRSRAGKWCWARERELDFFCFSCFPNGGATDIVLVTLFCIVSGTAVAWCGGPGRCAMPDGHYLNILLFWRLSTAASFEVSLFCPPFPTYSSLYLIGLLASVDVKQRKLTGDYTACY